MLELVGNLVMKHYFFVRQSQFVESETYQVQLNFCQERLLRFRMEYLVKVKEKSPLPTPRTANRPGLLDLEKGLEPIFLTSKGEHPNHWAIGYSGGNA